MRRMTTTTLLAAALIASYSPTASTAEATVQEITFTVTNPLEPGVSYEIYGRMSLPEGSCAGVLLLQHGLSYGAWGWDFPIQPETYSTVKALADAGYASVTIDRLGYGRSAHPDGYKLTVEGYADMTRQMMDQLRTGTYAAAAKPSFAKVGLMGHSAGTEVSEMTAALYGADALIATAYHHFPSQRIVTDFFTGDFVRAAQDDYEEFGGDEAGRTEYMYHLPNADPAVVAKDNELRNLTPSGEVYTIGPQPSRYVMNRITSPTLLVLAEYDLLFEPSFAEQEEALFVSAHDLTTMIVEDAGHSFMLHKNAAQTNASMIGWLQARPEAVPACA